MKKVIPIDLNTQLIYQDLKQQCEELSDQAKALAMKAYMKYLFDFYGINALNRKEISRTFKKNYKLVLDDHLWQLVEYLWADAHREMQYIAIDLLTPFANKMTAADLPQLENMIISKSWWDTVDGIAPALAGSIFRDNHQIRDQYVYRWMESENIWLQRSAIICQLKHGKDTDWNLLSEAILSHDTSKEFFVRKGQGWALRQYSKYNPLAVRQFVEANPQLSGLTKKEALRKI
ncbi:MAG: DNA alkylation repair protein [Saprospiraceae bacterium]|nr:DNA alkylation repair protein [Saprospiraceae bacterium]